MDWFRGMDVSEEDVVAEEDPSGTEEIENNSTDEDETTVTIWAPEPGNSVEINDVHVDEWVRVSASLQQRTYQFPKD